MVTRRSHRNRMARLLQRRGKDAHQDGRTDRACQRNADADGDAHDALLDHADGQTDRQSTEREGHAQGAGQPSDQLVDDLLEGCIGRGLSRNCAEDDGGRQVESGGSVVLQFERRSHQFFHH